MRGREDEWTGLMRSAMAGDDAAYHRLLKAGHPRAARGREARPGAGRAASRSGRGYRAGDSVGGASEAAHMGQRSALRALAVCDRPQQADRCAEAAGPAGLRQHRRFRRDAAGRGAAGDGFRRRGHQPSSTRCRSASATCCSRSRSRAPRSRTRRRNFR